MIFIMQFKKEMIGEYFWRATPIKENTCELVRINGLFGNMCGFIEVDDCNQCRDTALANLTFQN